MLYELSDVTFRYPEVTAVEKLSLSLAAGERVVVLGANGSGKSTLLRLLDALCFPASGTISFDGTALTEEAFSRPEFAFQFRRRVGLVFQNPDVQLFNATVFDEIAFAPLQLRWQKAEILDRVSAILDSMQITHLKDRAPHRLSGGEKKRVALASVLVLEPEVLLLDEPTAALDPQSQSRMIDFLAAAGGVRTVVTATHDLHIVEDIADRCLVFKGGCLEASGAPREILGNEALLRGAHLLHAHRHEHASGVTHSHTHLHGFHDHKH